MSYGMADSVSSLFTYKIMTVLFLGSEDIRGLQIRAGARYNLCYCDGEFW